MSLLDALSRRVSGVTAIIASLCTFALAIVITTDVVSRMVTSRSLPGLVEVSETLLVMLIFLGMAFASYTGGQIAVDLVTGALPKRVAAWMRSIGDAITLAILVWLVSATYTRALDSFLGGEYKFGLVHWPLWPARTSIVIGLLICIPIYVLIAWRDISEALGRQVPEQRAPATAVQI